MCTFKFTLKNMDKNNTPYKKERERIVEKKIIIILPLSVKLNICINIIKRKRNKESNVHSS